MSIAIIFHPDCELHDMGCGHPERPARVHAIQQQLQLTQFATPIKFIESVPATIDQLKRVHDADYVDWIFAIAPKSGSIAIDADTAMNPKTLPAALLAAGSVPLAVDWVMEKKAQVAFCNVRPPGHHAEKDRAMGFCFFNNVAVGVQHALDKHGIKRVAIIDFDVHHGNGTQDIFQNNPAVMLCSSFEYPQYPGYNPHNDNDRILNLPLKFGSGGAEFQKAVAEKWFAALDAFAPEFIFFSAGFDAHANDPLAGLQLHAQDYQFITTKIKELAIKHAHGRMVSVLEGGYDLNALRECVPIHINAMV